MTLHCKNCNAQLTEALWRDQGEYFIPCFGCGVRNIVLPMVQIVGYRKEAPLPGRRSPSHARATLSEAPGTATATSSTRVLSPIWPESTTSAHKTAREEPQERRSPAVTTLDHSPH